MPLETALLIFALGCLGTVIVHAITSGSERPSEARLVWRKLRKSLFGTTERGLWFLLAILSLVLAGGSIAWMSFLSSSGNIDPSASLYVAFFASVDPTKISERPSPQTSKLTVRLLPLNDEILIDIRIHAETKNLPSLLVSNVRNHKCFFGSDAAPYPLPYPVTAFRLDFDEKDS